MRDRYWAMYTTIKHKVSYHNHHLTRTKRFNGALTGICALFSAASVASWAIWNSVPWLWTTIVVVMQVIEVLHPRLPIAQQLASLKFLLPQINNLLFEIDKEWLRIEELDDKKIGSLINKFEKKFNDLETQFLDDVYYPTVSSCEEKAREECNIYFSHHYGVKEKNANV